MKGQEQTNYERVAAAIDYIQRNFKQQPNLHEVAEKVHLSPSHFQRIFTDWAGVSPKKFLQYISLEYAKQVLDNNQASIYEVAYEVGLSGTGRLHDLFVGIEAMTPGDYKRGGANLIINYSYNKSPFGDVLIASTTKGVCYMSFTKDERTAFGELQVCFPKAIFQAGTDTFQRNALNIYSDKSMNVNEVKLHLKGSNFQLKVWEALLKIPTGALATYGQVAKSIGNPKSSRAVGTAIGSNPVAFLIPCHRVIRSSGIHGGYMWGPTRKAAIIGWEAAKLSDAV